MKYFEVEAKCGHVGRKNCIMVQFAVVAKDGKEAAAKARQIPRVKHDHKDAIGYVKEITFEEFMVLRSHNDADPYLHCKSKREQRQIDISDRVVVDEYNVAREECKKGKKHDSEYRRLKGKIRDRAYSAMIKDYYREAI